jgi:DMSO/TMAO reductase YedYZ molybdopterin-dependent catalytic subunit
MHRTLAKVINTRRRCLLPSRSIVAYLSYAIATIISMIVSLVDSDAKLLAYEMNGVSLPRDHGYPGCAT